MAITPTVRGVTEGAGASSTSHTITFTQTTGDRVVIFLNFDATARTLSTVGDSFVNLTNTSARFHILTKVLDGTEGGNMVVTIGVASKSAWLAYNITTGTHASGTAPVFSTVATGTSTAPDSATLSPSGGSAKYLWLSAFSQAGEEADDDTWCSAAPSTPGTFTGLVQKTTGTTGAVTVNGSVAAAQYASETATVDPGAFTVAQSLAWRAYTVAIYPSLDINAPAECASGTGAAYGAAPSCQANAGAASGTGAAQWGGGGSVAFVKTLAYENNTTSGQTVTVASAGGGTVTAGNTIYVLGATYGSTVFGSEGVTDNLGNTYTLVGRHKKSGDNEGVHLYVAPVTVGGSLTTITFTHQASDYNQIISAEFSGVGSASGSVYDGEGTGTTGTFLSSGTIPANGIAVGAVMSSAGGTISAGSASGNPSTSISRADYWASGIYSALLYAIAGGSEVTAFTGTGTWASSSDWAGAGQAFSPTAGTVGATAKISPNAGVAAGAGTAYDPPFPVFTNAPAECASGTGVAYDPPIRYAPAGLASGTGAAHAPPPSISPNAAVASGTGTAHQPATSLKPNAGVAAGTGSANAAVVNLAPNAGHGAGTGTAYQPVAKPAPNAGLASGTGAAYPAAMQYAPAGQATGTGAAPSVAPKLDANAGLASGAGAAYQPTVDTGGTTTYVYPGCASGTGAAYPTAMQYAPAGLAAGTGVAYNGSVPTTRYISPSGSDSTGDGTIGNPWASVSKFYAIPPGPGATLYCRGGTYTWTGNQNVSVSGISGSSGAPITVIAYPGEVPVFHGDGTDYSDFLIINDGSQYHVIDGLQLEDYWPTQSGVIWVGDDALTTGHVTVRNCRVTLPDGLSLTTDHAVYASQNSTDVIVEYCVFVALGTCGAGFHQDHTPAAQDWIVRYCLFVGFDNFAITMWSSTTTGSILHNTFIDCTNLAIDARYHSTLLVRDNADDGSPVSGGDLYDPYDYAYTTTDHNFWDQTFDASYFLNEGQTGKNAASDGSDAGAYNIWRANAGAASGTGAAYSASPNVAASAGLASGTGTAFATTMRYAPAGLASGTGAAYAPAATVSPNAGVATGTGTAYATAMQYAPAGLAAGTGAAADTGKTVAPNAGAGTGTGAAYQPTVSGGTNAPAGHASGTGAALDATVTASPSVFAWADTATGSGAAYGAAIPTISGVTRDEHGTAIPLCTVDAFVSATNAFYGTTTSDGQGRYSIVVAPGVAYFLVAYSALDVYGVTARDLTA